MKTISMVLPLAVLLGCSLLTVGAIRCHQCNSYLDPGCADLQLNAGGPQGEKYLKDCQGVGETEATFCRKLDVTFLATTERRIVRNCGYVLPRRHNVDYCYNADNEGYTEQICQCYGEACNSARTIIQDPTLILIAGIVSFFVILR